MCDVSVSRGCNGRSERGEQNTYICRLFIEKDRGKYPCLHFRYCAYLFRYCACQMLYLNGSLACTVEQQQSEYQCEERYCLYDTDNDEVVSSTLACCSESIRCSSCASALEEG